MQGDNTIQAVLIGAIASMAGFIVWLFRFVVSTQNERIQKLEGDMANATNANTKALTENTATLQDVAGTVTALADILIEKSPRYIRRGAPPGASAAQD